MTNAFYPLRSDRSDSPVTVLSHSCHLENPHKTWAFRALVTEVTVLFISFGRKKSLDAGQAGKGDVGTRMVVYKDGIGKTVTSVTGMAQTPGNTGFLQVTVPENSCHRTVTKTRELSLKTPGAAPGRKEGIPNESDGHPQRNTVLPGGLSF